MRTEFTQVGFFTDPALCNHLLNKLEDQQVEYHLAREGPAARLFVPKTQETRAQGILAAVPAASRTETAAAPLPCPKCRSTDVARRATRYQIPLLSIFFGFRMAGYRLFFLCGQCGHRWR